MKIKSVSLFTLCFCIFSELLVGAAIDFLEAKIVVKVHNEKGELISGAEVLTEFSDLRRSGWGAAMIPVEGVTDKNGSFSANLKTLNTVFVSAYKEGYHPTIGFPVVFEDKNASQWLPWENEVTIVLHPHNVLANLVGKNVRIFFPSGNNIMPYDLRAGDFVKPLGKGIESDVIFKINRMFSENNIQAIEIEIILGESKTSGVMNLPRSDSPLWTRALNAQKNLNYEKSILLNLKSNGLSNVAKEIKQDFIFKTKSGYFGVIANDLIYCLDKNGDASIQFDYLINSEKGSENLEHLSKDIHWLR